METIPLLMIVNSESKDKIEVNTYSSWAPKRIPVTPAFWYSHPSILLGTLLELVLWPLKYHRSDGMSLLRLYYIHFSFHLGCTLVILSLFLSVSLPLSLSLSLLTLKTLRKHVVNNCMKKYMSWRTKESFQYPRV